MPLICTLDILSLRQSTTLIIGPPRDHGIVSRSTADLTWRLWFKSTEVTRNYFFASSGPQIPFAWANTYWSLWVTCST